jgi:hypothetical protein
LKTFSAGRKSSVAQPSTIPSPTSTSDRAARRVRRCWRPGSQSGGRLELTGEELAVTCRELAHEFRDFPTGRIVLRQRESDDFVAKLVLYDGRPLTIAERKARLELRDKLASKESDEAPLSEGLRLLLSDPTVASWMFTIYRDSGDAARAVMGFVNHRSILTRSL